MTTSQIPTQHQYLGNPFPPLPEHSTPVAQRAASALWQTAASLRCAAARAIYRGRI